MRELISIDEASTLLARWVEEWASSERRDSEIVDLRAAKGRRLAFAVTADRPLPPYDRVMMDGVAVNAGDWAKGIQDYQLVASTPAGSMKFSSVGEGEAVEVMTGTVCPGNPNDTVIVPVERLISGMPAIGAMLKVEEKAQDEIVAGQYIHCCGTDAAAGDVLLDVGTRLGSMELGVLATCGMIQVRVKRRLGVAVIVTGDELVEVGTQPEAHQIRRSNDITMVSFVDGVGAELVELVHVNDERGSLAVVVAELATRADVVLISGGASMGSKDHVSSVLDDLCGEALFHGVRQRPGKPFGVWDGGTSLFCALPGNPVSVMACLCRHVGPLLAAMDGGWMGPEKRLVEVNGGYDGGFGMLKPVEDIGEGAVRVLEMNNSGDFNGVAGLAGFVELIPHSKNEKSPRELDFYRLY